jgi:hypothetical protein
LDRSEDGDRDLSDSEESPPTRYRSCSQPPSRRESIDYSNQSGPNQRPALMVRRVGSRQMLVLGDEASIHGKMIPLLSIGRYSSPLLVHFVNEPDFLHLNRSSVQDLGQTNNIFHQGRRYLMVCMRFYRLIYIHTHTLCWILQDEIFRETHSSSIVFFFWKTKCGGINR